MGKATVKSKKLVGIVATATLATSMIAGTSNASAQTTDSLKVSEPVQERAEDKKLTLFVPPQNVVFVGDTFDPMKDVWAKDKNGKDITSRVTYTGDDKVDLTKMGEYELTFTVSDDEGNTVVQKQRVVVRYKHVTNTAPTILILRDKITLNIGDTFDPMEGVTGSDSEEGILTHKITYDNGLDTSKPGTYYITYYLMDSQGKMDLKTRTITVIDQSPVITTPDEFVITEGEQFDPMAGVKATDPEDGDITSKVEYEYYTGSVNKPGTYKVYYKVKDSFGNTANTVATLIVREKITPVDEAPELKVPTATTITEGDKFNPMSGVSATDKEDGDITSKVTVDGSVDASKPGTYELTYTVSDSKGHTVTAKQTVTVKQKVEIKNEAPELTVPFTSTLRVGEKFDPMAGVSATDKEDGNLTNKVKYKGNVDTSKPGKYIVEYWVVDSKGVNATATQSVIVKENEETPDMEPKLTVPTGATINVGDKFDPMAGVKAIDNEDGDITDKVTVDGSVDASKPGTYELTYTVSDSKGHTVTAKQTATVKQKVEPTDEAPVLTVPAEATINVGDKFNPLAGVKAIDNEDGDITNKVTVDGSVDASKPGTYVLTYTVTDSNGHTVTAKQTVTVKQKVEPKDEDPILTVPAEVIINMDDNYNPLAGVTAIDNEDGDITSKVIHMGEVDTSKAGNFEVKFLVRDASGNEVTATQKVIVKDKDTENGSDNNNNNTNSGNSSDNSNNNTNSGNISDNNNTSSNNNTTSTLDNKKDTIKELPKTGASSNNGTAAGILAILAGMLITFGRKLKKTTK
ncbi:immunoglobulin-like domain-containing protein [Bacillus toyonensis]|uniref:immunoglobulin-like domain-containing protein n=1 Tax=Bacillus toyonensis TaxID=155322 RepID=UPI000BEFBA18|nr:immunoglobulin-like domain-containing protein [Bacillus toyonensis]PEJ91310.1 cell wall anchor protein [Bacillus toyonensis]PEK82974.1 cell wall anchor protein [Bacillus toyonensis]PFY41371.1 cell wall anchor protein [Bacillus toyonensis]PFY47057.1 cell wall anchor protein [Bacillus toyonensis]PFY64509.1 cell wall anchor protein [Bacillus toyonensis]